MEQVIFVISMLALGAPKASIEITKITCSMYTHPPFTFCFFSNIRIILIRTPKHTAP